MKKNLFILLFAVICIFALSAGDIPFLKSLFMGDEEYIRQQILKNCKDVETVELELFYTDNYDTENYDIRVYLTNNRYINFSDVQLGRFIKNDSPQGVSMLIWQINDLHPAELRLEINKIENDNILYDLELKGLEIKFLPKIMLKTKVDNIFDIINSFDEVYRFVNNLPEIPKETPFYKTFTSQEIPKELKFFLIENEENPRGFYEYGYNFYKMTVEDAQKKYIHGQFKTGF